MEGRKVQEQMRQHTTADTCGWHNMQEEVVYYTNYCNQLTVSSCSPKEVDTALCYVLAAQHKSQKVENTYWHIGVWEHTSHAVKNFLNSRPLL